MGRNALRNIGCKESKSKIFILIRCTKLTFTTRLEISRSKVLKGLSCPLLISPRAYNFGEFENGKARQALPPCFAQEEAQLNQFQKYCHKMMQKINTLFGIGLKVSAVIIYQCPIGD